MSALSALLSAAPLVALYALGCWLEGRERERQRLHAVRSAQTLKDSLAAGEEGTGGEVTLPPVHPRRQTENDVQCVRLLIARAEALVEQAKRESGGFHRA